MTDLAALVLRLVMGSIFLAQGYRKLFGPAEASHGRANLTRMIAEKGFPLPGRLAVLTSLTEFTGGTLLVVGLLTRLALLPLLVIVAMAVLVFKREAGFFGGWDWPFSVLGGSTALLLLGSGRYSLDALLAG